MAGRRRRRDDNGFEQWGGYMAAKQRKLQDQYVDEAVEQSAKSNIFNGVAIFVNGYTDPPAADLRQLMAVHGGTYEHYEGHNTTHVIATNLPKVKINQLKDKKVVKPDWIVDSIKAGTLLDYRLYLLYDTSEKYQKRLNFGNHSSIPRAGDPNFLSEFYGHSRLHHIATMGAELKQHVNELRSKGGGTFPGRTRLKTWAKSQTSRDKETFLADTVIMHLDMDCFFVSVGLRNHPELKGHPVAVTHSRGNSVKRLGDLQYEREAYRQKGRRALDLDDNGSMAEVASCSYEARKAGVGNGMLLGTALKLCPNLKTVPYDFEGYKEVSYKLYGIVASFTHDIEAVSCDEMFIDCTSVLRDADISPIQFAQFIRTEIAEATSCTASSGLGPNILIARMATRRAKPNGEYFVDVDSSAAFIKSEAVSSLPGVGRSVGHKLKNMDIKTCEDLQKCTLSQLKSNLGAKLGESLYNFCRGIDTRQLSTHHVRKSVSAEINYGIRLQTHDETTKFVKDMAAEVCQRMQEVKVRGSNLTLKLKVRAADAPMETAKYMGHGICDNITKSIQLPVATCDPSVISANCLALLQQIGVDEKDYRGFGIQMTKLESETTDSSKSIKEFFEKQPKKCYHTPTASQLNSEVLDELPPDIRAEVLAEYALPRAKEPDKQSPEMDAAVFSGPSTSSTRQAHQKPETDLVIDKDFLSALPEDIRKEVEANLKFHCKAFPALSPNKNMKVSPRKKTTAAGKGQKKLSCYIVNAKVTDHDTAPSITEEINCSDDSQISDDFHVTQCSVQDQIRNWMSASDMTAAENDIRSHFRKLVTEDCLEELKKYINCLYRFILKIKAPDNWKSVYCRAVDAVQEDMLKFYKMKLKVSQF